jgi:hypothetical protein
VFLNYSNFYLFRSSIFNTLIINIIQKLIKKKHSIITKLHSSNNSSKYKINNIKQNCLIFLTYHIPRIKSSNNPGKTKSSVPASHLRPNICIDGIVVIRRPKNKNYLLVFTKTKQYFDIGYL